MIPIHVTYRLSPFGSEQTAIVWVSEELNANDVMNATLESVFAPYTNKYSSRNGDMDWKGISPYIEYVVLGLKADLLGLRYVNPSDSFDI